MFDYFYVITKMSNFNWKMPTFGTSLFATKTLFAQMNSQLGQYKQGKMQVSKLLLDRTFPLRKTRERERDDMWPNPTELPR